MAAIRIGIRPSAGSSFDAARRCLIRPGRSDQLTDGAIYRRLDIERAEVNGRGVGLRPRWVAPTGPIAAAAYPHLKGGRRFVLDVDRAGCPFEIEVVFR